MADARVAERAKMKRTQSKAPSLHACRSSNETTSESCAVISLGFASERICPRQESRGRLIKVPATMYLSYDAVPDYGRWRKKKAVRRGVLWVGCHGRQTMVRSGTLRLLLFGKAADGGKWRPEQGQCSADVADVCLWQQRTRTIL